MRKQITILCIVLLTACGGGGSSSGGQQRYQGSDDFVKTMKDVEHRFKANRVNAIIEGGTFGNDLAGYYRGQNIIRITNKWRNQELDELAGILAHENTHAKQPKSTSHAHAIEKEQEAFAIQVAFLQSIGRHDLAGKWASEDGSHVCRDW